jgi:hypothetical protein
VDGLFEQRERLALKVELLVGVLRDQPCRLCTFLADERSSRPAMLGMIARNRSVFATSMRAASIRSATDRDRTNSVGSEGDAEYADPRPPFRPARPRGRDLRPPHRRLSTTAHFIHHLPRCSSCNG